MIGKGRYATKKAPKPFVLRVIGTCVACQSPIPNYRGVRWERNDVCKNCYIWARDNGKRICTHPEHEGDRALSPDWFGVIGEGLRYHCKRCLGQPGPGVTEVRWDGIKTKAEELEAGDYHHKALRLMLKRGLALPTDL